MKFSQFWYNRVTAVSRQRYRERYIERKLIDLRSRAEDGSKTRGNRKRTKICGDVCTVGFIFWPYLGTHIVNLKNPISTLLYQFILPVS